MRTAWDVLTDAGVPDGAPRTPPGARLDTALVARALSDVGRDPGRLPPHELECLGAWLAAFRHHWPDRFDAILGPVGARVLDHFRASEVDPNRYLKLRRIAAENLARRL